eukprot:10252330-Alexandrium_andersonii.AAC.1
MHPDGVLPQGATTVRFRPSEKVKSARLRSSVLRCRISALRHPRASAYRRGAGQNTHVHTHAHTSSYEVQLRT